MGAGKGKSRRTKTQTIWPWNVDQELKQIKVDHALQDLFRRKIFGSIKVIRISGNIVDIDGEEVVQVVVTASDPRPDSTWPVKPVEELSDYINKLLRQVDSDLPETVINLEAEPKDF